MIVDNKVPFLFLIEFIEKISLQKVFFCVPKERSSEFVNLVRGRE